MQNNKSLKLISTLLCAVMLLAPFSALAAAWDDTPDLPFFAVEPYMTREEYLARPVDDGVVSIQAADDGRIFAAAAKLREGMLNHENTIDITMYDPDVIYDSATASDTASAIYDFAFAETGVAYQGDYLLNSVKGRSWWTNSSITCYI